MNKFASFFYMFVATSITPTLAADWEGVFEGTLGKARILVELNAGSEKSEYKGGFADGSRYSYVPKAFDLKLGLESEGKTLEFAEATVPHYAIADLPKDDPARTGHWSLSVSDDSATGTWTSRDGRKTLPIRLMRRPLVDESEVPKDLNQLSVTYNTLWFAHEKIAGADKPLRFGDVTLAFEKDSAFNVEMPVFTGLPDAGRMTKANGLLRHYYKQSLMTNRDCINGLEREPDNPFEPEYAFSVIYASAWAVTLQESGSVFCGGAHPNNYVSYLTFDLVNMKQIGGEYELDLSPEGFGTVLKLATKDERIAFENFALSRWQDAAKAAGESGEDSCAGMGFLADQPPGEKHFTLAFMPKGLGVQRTDYPSVAANCLDQDFNPAVIPWADLKPWLKPGQTLLTDELQ